MNTHDILLAYKRLLGKGLALQQENILKPPSESAVSAEGRDLIRMNLSPQTKDIYMKQKPAVNQPQMDPKASRFQTLRDKALNLNSAHSYNVTAAASDAHDNSKSANLDEHKLRTIIGSVKSVKTNQEIPHQYPLKISNGQGIRDASVKVVHPLQPTTGRLNKRKGQPAKRRATKILSARIAVADDGGEVPASCQQQQDDKDDPSPLVTFEGAVPATLAPPARDDEQPTCGVNIAAAAISSRHSRRRQQGAGDAVAQGSTLHGAKQQQADETSTDLLADSSTGAGAPSRQQAAGTTMALDEQQRQAPIIRIKVEPDEDALLLLAANTSNDDDEPAASSCQHFGFTAAERSELIRDLGGMRDEQVQVGDLPGGVRIVQQADVSTDGGSHLQDATAASGTTTVAASGPLKRVYGLSTSTFTSAATGMLMVSGTHDPLLWLTYEALMGRPDGQVLWAAYQEALNADQQREGGNGFSTCLEPTQLLAEVYDPQASTVMTTHHQHEQPASHQRIQQPGDDHNRSTCCHSSNSSPPRQQEIIIAEPLVPKKHPMLRKSGGSTRGNRKRGAAGTEAATFHSIAAKAAAAGNKIAATAAAATAAAAAALPSDDVKVCHRRGASRSLNETGGTTSSAAAAAAAAVLCCTGNDSPAASGDPTALVTAAISAAVASAAGTREGTAAAGTEGTVDAAAASYNPATARQHNDSVERDTCKQAHTTAQQQQQLVVASTLASGGGVTADGNNAPSFPEVLTQTGLKRKSMVGLDKEGAVRRKAGFLCHRLICLGSNVKEVRRLAALAAGTSSAAAHAAAANGSRTYAAAAAAAAGSTLPTASHRCVATSAAGFDIAAAAAMVTSPFAGGYLAPAAIATETALKLLLHPPPHPVFLSLLNSRHRQGVQDDAVSTIITTTTAPVVVIPSSILQPAADAAVITSALHPTSAADIPGSTKCQQAGSTGVHRRQRSKVVTFADEVVALVGSGQAESKSQSSGLLGQYVAERTHVVAERVHIVADKWGAECVKKDHQANKQAQDEFLHAEGHDDDNGRRIASRSHKTRSRLAQQGPHYAAAAAQLSSSAVQTAAEAGSPEAQHGTTDAHCRPAAAAASTFVHTNEDEGGRLAQQAAKAAEPIVPSGNLQDHQAMHVLSAKSDPGTTTEMSGTAKEVHLGTTTEVAVTASAAREVHLGTTTEVSGTAKEVHLGTTTEVAGTASPAREVHLGTSPAAVQGAAGTRGAGGRILPRSWQQGIAAAAAGQSVPRSPPNGLPSAASAVAASTVAAPHLMDPLILLGNGTTTATPEVERSAPHSMLTTLVQVQQKNEQKMIPQAGHDHHAAASLSAARPAGAADEEEPVFFTAEAAASLGDIIITAAADSEAAAVAPQMMSTEIITRKCHSSSSAASVSDELEDASAAMTTTTSNLLPLPQEDPGSCLEPAAPARVTKTAGTTLLKSGSVSCSASCTDDIIVKGRKSSQHCSDHHPSVMVPVVGSSQHCNDRPHVVGGIFSAAPEKFVKMLENVKNRLFFASSTTPSSTAVAATAGSKRRATSSKGRSGYYYASASAAAASALAASSCATAEVAAADGRLSSGLDNRHDAAASAVVEASVAEVAWWDQQQQRQQQREDDAVVLLPVVGGGMDAGCSVDAVDTVDTVDDDDDQAGHLVASAGAKQQSALGFGFMSCNEAEGGGGGHNLVHLATAEVSTTYQHAAAAAAAAGTTTSNTATIMMQQRRRISSTASIVPVVLTDPASDDATIMKADYMTATQLEWMELAQPAELDLSQSIGIHSVGDLMAAVHPRFNSLAGTYFVQPARDELMTLPDGRSIHEEIIARNKTHLQQQLLSHNHVTVPRITQLLEGAASLLQSFGGDDGCRNQVSSAATIRAAGPSFSKGASGAHCDDDSSGCPACSNCPASSKQTPSVTALPWSVVARPVIITKSALAAGAGAQVSASATRLPARTHASPLLLHHNLPPSPAQEPQQDEQVNYVESNVADEKTLLVESPVAAPCYNHHHQGGMTDEPLLLPDEPAATLLMMTYGVPLNNGSSFSQQPHTQAQSHPFPWQ